MPASPEIEIRLLQAGDEHLLANPAPEVFDFPTNPALIREFLADPRHHIAVAIDQNRVVGFATALHYIHPDKPAALWINEVAIAPTHRQRGLAKAILQTLFDLARKNGWSESWVLTDGPNLAANRLYTSLGGRRLEQVMYDYKL